LGARCRVGSVIVWLASYPRSGNTLYRLLLHCLCGVVTYSIYDDPQFERMGISEVIGHRLLPASLDELASSGETYFVKTHTRPRDDGPAVLVVRDGRDVMVSLARYSTDTDRSARQTYREVLWDLVTAGSGHDHWGEHVTSWRRRSALTAVVRYENLLTDPVGEVERSLAEAGFRTRPTEAALPEFGELHARWPGFFRRGRPGAWREEMDSLYQEMFWLHHREAMECLKYS
jgi:hypothetical protein